MNFLRRHAFFQLLYVYEYTHSGYFYIYLQYIMYINHIIVSDISLKKLDALGYISVRESLGISSTIVTQYVPHKLPNSVK